MCMNCIHDHQEAVLQRLSRLHQDWLNAEMDGSLPLCEHMPQLLEDLQTVIKEMPSREKIESEDPEDEEEFLDFLGNFTKFVGAAHYLVRLMMAAYYPDDEEDRKLIGVTRITLDFLYGCIRLPDQPTLAQERIVADAMEGLKEHIQEAVEKKPVPDRLLN